MKWDTDATDVVLEIIEVAASTVELDRLVKEADTWGGDQITSICRLM